MGKRKRTQSRTEEAFLLAQTAVQQGWSSQRLIAEIDSLIAKNSDLIDAKAIDTFRKEAMDLSDARLRGLHSLLDCLAKKSIDRQPPGGPLRYNHQLLKYCRRALRHPAGPTAAFGEIQSELGP